MKIKYKNLKKKESVFKLITEYGKSLLLWSFLSFIVVALCVGGVIVSKCTGSSIFEGIIDFAAAICGALLLFGVVVIFIMNLYTLFTYIRAFFRYAYLPLTIDEAKALKIDKDPVAYVKTLTEMMCYKQEFTDNVVVIYNPDTDKKLSNLFYQLFFCKNGDNEPIIFDVLINWKKREELIETLTTIKKIYGYSDKQSLIKSLTGIYDMLREVPEIKIIDAVVFESHSHYIKKNSYGMDVKAILETENHFYLINNSEWFKVSKDSKMMCMSDFLLSTHFTSNGSIMTTL